MQISQATKVTLLLLSMVTMMSNVAIVTSLPHLKDHFPDVKEIEFLSRLMITLPSLSIAILAPFLGHHLHRIRRKSSTVAALFLFALAGSAGLYLEGIGALLLSRALLGVAIAVLMIVTTALVGDYFAQASRHRYMGMQRAFTSVGGFIFLIGGGLLSDFGWRLPFAIYLVGLLFIPLTLLFLVEPSQPSEELGEEIPPKLFGIYALAFVLMLIFYVLPTQMPFLMINHFGASGMLTGAIISTAFVSNALGALSFSRLKKHYDFKSIYVIGIAIVGFGFLLMGSVQEVHLFFVTAPIMGFGGGILMTNVTAWMLSRSHESRRV
ncbi:MAG: MFS transporter, partial [Thiovulaceae bacterium]|nr:MFS transporter [Sulfurimonadaceae bacterium]